MGEASWYSRQLEPHYLEDWHNVIYLFPYVFLETLIQAMRIYSQDIGMEFGIEKCAMVILKSGKRHIAEGIELPNQGKIRTLREKEDYKCLRIMGADIIKQAKMKEKILKRVSQENEKTTRNQII